MSGPEREAMSQEQAADLARLEAMAGEGQGQEAGAAPEQEAAPQPPDPVESLAGAFTIGAMMAGALGYRRVADVWAPPVCRGLSEKVVPVLAKYPWGQRVIEFLNTGAGVEEIALAFYVAPLVMATREAAKADAAELAAKARARKKPEAEAEGDVIEAQAVTAPEAEAGEVSGMAWAAP